MMGDNTLWQPGTDHAGIATQMVERQLNAQGINRHDLGRYRKVWEWKGESGGNITRQPAVLAHRLTGAVNALPCG